MLKKIALFSFLLLTVFGLTLSVSAQEPDKSAPIPTYGTDVRKGDFVNPDTVEKSAGNSEIERKFYIDLEDIPADLEDRANKYSITQSYISFSPEIRLRRLNSSRRSYYYMNIKVDNDDIGLSRDESQYQISYEQYSALLGKKSGRTINKTRYQFEDEGAMVYLDVYHGFLDGLATAEVEFDNLKEANAFKKVSWFGKELTSDQRYKNGSLARYGIPTEK